MNKDKFDPSKNLAPCPYCMSWPTFGREPNNSPIQRYYVICNSCQYHIGSPTFDQVVIGWNGHPKHRTINNTDEVAKLNEKIKQLQNHIEHILEIKQENKDSQDLQDISNVTKSLTEQYSRLG